jgi:hypothetical protein
VTDSLQQVLRVNAIDRVALAVLLERFGLQLTLTAPEEVIPGSYWGDSEAGLKGQRLYARLDTPVHSVLHEASHFVCMSPERRAGLDRDAGGSDLEEAAVCYLQVLLAEQLPQVGRERLFRAGRTGCTAVAAPARRAGRGRRGQRRISGRGSLARSRAPRAA